MNQRGVTSDTGELSGVMGDVRSVRRMSNEQEMLTEAVFMRTKSRSRRSKEDEEEVAA